MLIPCAYIVATPVSYNMQICVGIAPPGVGLMVFIRGRSLGQPDDKAAY